MTGRAVFYARVADLSLLDLVEFYAEDIHTLERLGYDVMRTNSAVTAARADGDLLLAWWFHSALPVVAAWRLRRKPVIVTGTVDLTGPAIGGRSRRLARGALAAASVRLASATVSISDVENRALQRIGAPRLTCIPLTVDTDFFSPGPVSAAPTAVMVAQVNGHSVHRKGIDVAVEATELVRRTHPAFELHVAGPVTPAGRRALYGHGVVVHGAVSRDEKRALMASAWCVLQPSVYEGFGLAVLEAMACGATPIVSTAGALPEVVGDAGTLVPPGDPAAVARAVVALIDGDRSGRSAAARDRALTFRRSVHDARYAAVVDAVTR